MEQQRDQAQRVQIRPHDGARASLRSLFELAEDSAEALDAYIDEGQVLVAVAGGNVLGHLQLTPSADAAILEVKNMAVVEEAQGQGVGQGVGSALVDAALELSRKVGASRVVVATAAADVGNLRFYQRRGFRMLEVERDAFTEHTGYPPDLLIDGVKLRDRIWLDRPV